jgi:hypothetical protein
LLIVLSKTKNEAFLNRLIKLHKKKMLVKKNNFTEVSVSVGEGISCCDPSVDSVSVSLAALAKQTGRFQSFVVGADLD